MRTGVVGFVNHRLLLLEHRSWDLLACTQTSRLVQLLRSSAYHVLRLLDRLLARLLKARSWDLYRHAQQNEYCHQSFHTQYIYHVLHLLGGLLWVGIPWRQLGRRGLSLLNLLSWRRLALDRVPVRWRRRAY